MYHVASSERRGKIKSLGLLTRYDQTGLGAIFLADARPVYCEGFDIWIVDVDGLALEEDFSGEPDHGKWWMHFGDIAPERLSISRDDLSPSCSPSPL